MDNSEDNALHITFKINTNIYTINVPANDGDEDLQFRLTNDDDYTVQYLKNIIDNGLIKIKEPLQSIWRVTDEDEYISIYSESQDDEDNVENYPAEINDRNSWGQPETKYLLDRYASYIKEVGPTKKFKNKKAMWQQIASDLIKDLNVQKTYLQVENRYKTICKRKKDAVDNNSTSGFQRMEVPYEAEMNNIAALDDSIEPEVLRSAQGVKILKTPRNTRSESDFKLKRKRLMEPKRSIQETLHYIHEKKEESRERRHQEKLHLIRELFVKK